MINEEQAKHVRWIFAQALAGVPLTRIAKEMNEKGLRTLRGNAWQAATIREMIGNEGDAIIIAKDAERAIPHIRYAITSNGAVTTDLQSGERLRGAYLNDLDAKEIARIPMERNLIHSVFVGGIGYCEQEYFKDQWALYMGTKHERYIRKSRKGTEYPDPDCSSDRGGGY